VDAICNLLDIEHEPTDDQLAQLMALVGQSVNERAGTANIRFREHMAEEMRRATEDVAQQRRLAQAA